MEPRGGLDTGLSVYAALWLIGDLHAVRLRPVRIAGDVLQVRLGLRWSVAVPLGSIRSARAPGDDERPPRRSHLRAVPLGAPNRRIELTEPATATGPCGLSRQVMTIDLRLDEPERFDAALGPRVKGSSPTAPR